jgi:cytoskeleton protein RodZ
MGSFGDRLKKEREQRSVSLDDIALSTKIGTRMLRALEEEKFDQLPGGIFNKGFVRAYARHLGLDEQQTINDYMEALGENQQRSMPSDATAVPRPQPVAERPTKPILETREPERGAEIPWGLLALGLLLAALAFATWSYYHRTRGDDRSAATPATEVQPAPAGSTSGAGAPRQIPTTPTDGNHAPTTPIPSTEKTGAQASPMAQAALHGAASSADVAPGAFTVLLKGNNDSDECWVSIIADGQPPVEVTLSAPQEKSIQANREVIVKAGNVGALDVFFNGHKLPRLGEYGTVRTLTFRSNGLQPRVPKAPDSAATPP